MRIILYSFLLILLSTNARTQVIINEISYNPPEAGTDSLEYIELFNAGFAQIDITGWYFTSGITDTLPSTQLLPGEYFVVAANSGAMMNVFHVNVRQWISGALSNIGETIVLVDAAGNFMDSVAYDDVDPWPVEADGNGPSLELKEHTSDNNDGANWQASGGSTGVIINGNEVKGTPGAQNSSGGTPSPDVTVSAANFQFTPPHVVIAIGDSVRWVNQEFEAHNVNGSQSLFPGNPESFFSGLPASGPWQFDYEFNVAGLNDYQCDAHVSMGMRGTVAVYDPDGYTPFPLKHLRLTDGINGQHIFNGVPTVVAGVVHGINFQPSGYSFFIVDENNVGINVFSFDPGFYTVTQGDEVEIKGVIDQFNGLLEIIPDEISLLSTGNALTPPEAFFELNEETEGSHLALAPFTIDSIVPDASGFNVFVKDEQDNPVTIRVDFDLGITAVDLIDANAVRGIGSQFDSNFPYTEGYQLMALEFMHVSRVPVISRDAIRMSPNPASNAIIFQADGDMHEIQIYSTEGKLMLSHRTDTEFEPVDISALADGLYFVKVVMQQGIWTSLLTVVKG